jgi:hypothetical protein
MKAYFSLYRRVGVHPPSPGWGAGEAAVAEMIREGSATAYVEDGVHMLAMKDTRIGRTEGGGDGADVCKVPSHPLHLKLLI